MHGAWTEAAGGGSEQRVTGRKLQARLREPRFLPGTAESGVRRTRSNNEILSGHTHIPKYQPQKNKMCSSTNHTVVSGLM